MISYQETVDFLMQRLPMFSAQGAAAIREGLGNITELCKALGDPHQKFPSVHIAGTNGKGSTSHMIAGALQQAGYKTGLYTSPHLVSLTERIRINGVPVPEEFVVRFVEQARALIDRVQPSYFELNVAMAFTAFAEAQVDVAVIETGLGGRLDSTNIIHPMLSVITNIGLDHTHILGNTLPLIAAEKAGIIKEKVPVVVGETHPETEQVFFLHALRCHTAVVFADSIWEMVRTGYDSDYQYFKAIHKGEQRMYDLKTDLLGSFQSHNIKTALTACELLAQAGWSLPREMVMQSLERVRASTGLRGRWERIQQEPEIILDVAHNPDGMEFLRQNLQASAAGGPGSRLLVVCGFVKDKDIDTALDFFPKEAQYFFTQAQIPRALPYTELVEAGRRKGLEGQGFAHVGAAVAAAREAAAPHDRILITGSFFIVGEALALLEGSARS